jgi:hypothetical protein
MSMSVRATPKGDFLYVEADGEFDLSEATRTFGIVVDLMMANDCQRVLFDGRRISGEPTAVERYYYAAFASDAVNLLRDNGWLFDRPQFAFVLNEPVLDPLRLGQIVAKKRDMRVKAFDNLEDAMRWLDVSREDVPLVTEKHKEARHARK